MVPCAPHGRQAAFLSDACGHADRRSRLVALDRCDRRLSRGPPRRPHRPAPITMVAGNRGAARGRGRVLASHTVPDASVPRRPCRFSVVTPNRPRIPRLDGSDRRVAVGRHRSGHRSAFGARRCSGVVSTRGDRFKTRAASRGDRRGGPVSLGGMGRVSTIASRRRAALPGHHTEPAPRSRSENRKQPSSRRLPRVLRGRPPTGLPETRHGRRDLFDSCARAFVRGHSGLCAVRISRRRLFSSRY